MIFWSVLHGGESVWGWRRSVELSGSDVHDVEQFIQWPPVHHWLKHLQILTKDASRLLD